MTFTKVIDLTKEMHDCCVAEKFTQLAILQQQRDETLQMLCNDPTINKQAHHKELQTLYELNQRLCQLVASHHQASAEHLQTFKTNQNAADSYAQK